MLALVHRAGGTLLHEVSLFDVYEGDQVPPGKRSLALRLVMRSPERTLDRQGHRQRAPARARRPRAGVRRDAALSVEA